MRVLACCVCIIALMMLATPQTTAEQHEFLGTLPGSLRSIRTTSCSMQNQHADWFEHRTSAAQ